MGLPIFRTHFLLFQIPLLRYFQSLLYHTFYFKYYLNYHCFTSCPLRQFLLFVVFQTAAVNSLIIQLLVYSIFFLKNKISGLEVQTSLFFCSILILVSQRVYQCTKSTIKHFTFSHILNPSTLCALYTPSNTKADQHR